MYIGLGVGENWRNNLDYSQEHMQLRMVLSMFIEKTWDSHWKSQKEPSIYIGKGRETCENAFPVYNLAPRERTLIMRATLAKQNKRRYLRITVFGSGRMQIGRVENKHKTTYVRTIDVPLLLIIMSFLLIYNKLNNQNTMCRPTLIYLKMVFIVFLIIIFSTSYKIISSNETR